jgi:hypothetical protein
MITSASAMMQTQTLPRLSHHMKPFSNSHSVIKFVITFQRKISTVFFKEVALVNITFSVMVHLHWRDFALSLHV